MRCDLGAFLEYEVIFANRTVSPTGASQVFDFEIVVWADDVVEVERIPVRVMVPDAAAHEFDDTPASTFYRNVYDSTDALHRAGAPKWGDLTWEGTTPGASSIEFQIRTAPSLEDLLTAIPASSSRSPICHERHVQPPRRADRGRSDRRTAVHPDHRGSQPDEQPARDSDARRLELRVRLRSCGMI